MISDRRDHLLRQIEQLGQFAARLLGLTAKSVWAEAEETLAEAYRSLAGLPKDMLDFLDVATLRKLLQNDPNKVSPFLQRPANRPRCKDAPGTLRRVHPPRCGGRPRHRRRAARPRSR